MLTPREYQVLTSNQLRREALRDANRYGGKTGKKLKWDLNQNGRIDRSERTITEQELYAATAH